MEEKKDDLEKTQVIEPVTPITPVEPIVTGGEKPQVSEVAMQTNNTTPNSVTPISSNPSKPQVVKVEKTKEVIKEVPVNQKNENTPPPEVPIENGKINEPKRRRGSSIFLILLMLFLFAFVFFLPEITKYVSDYMAEKNNTGDTSMKSGRTTCYITKTAAEVNTNIEMVFTYEKNKLKTQKTTTTYKLTDMAPSNQILNEYNANCEHLQSVLAGLSGIEASCAVTATVQTTTQTIDYNDLDVEYITENIAEFEGYYPEYELDDSIVAIRKELEQSGYTCTANES